MAKIGCTIAAPSHWEHKKLLDFEKNWKTRTIKEAIYSEENEHHINGISFKLPNIWKPILRESKAKKTETTLRYFDPLHTHINTIHTLTHLDYCFA